VSKALQSQFTRLVLNGKSIEVALHELTSTSDTILLLHEALGSVSYWKDFPQRLALATGSNVILYSRPGHGDSEGPLGVRGEEHYRTQAQVVIPALVEHFSIGCPVVYGHSEGAGIATLYASSTKQAKALILESPFVVSERSASLHIEKIAASYPGSKLQERLAHYHKDADGVFYSWVNWAMSLEEGFSPLRDVLPEIACPVLVLQGASDEFGSAMHLAALQASLPDLEHEVFADTGHLPHRERTDLLLNRVSRFVTGTHHRAGRFYSTARV
jgi:pimeloyl-ACP methyl ester carboxylesterase